MGGGLKNTKLRFPTKIALPFKKVCYRVSLCENRQQHSCKSFIGLSIHAKMVVGDGPLNINFALSVPSLGAAAVRVTTFMKSDKYPICIAMIRMKYEIYNNVQVFECIT